jgi:4-carboxymuconolactone decarboxylase
VPRGLTDGQRRLLLIGMLAAQGPTTCSASSSERPTARRARRGRAAEIAIFLAHYAGWPVGARTNMVVEETIGKGR